MCVCVCVCASVCASVCVCVLVDVYMCTTCGCVWFAGMDEPVSNMPMSPADLHGMWYPTVRRTLVTLSKLYRCIDVSTVYTLVLRFHFATAHAIHT